MNDGHGWKKAASAFRATPSRARIAGRALVLLALTACAGTIAEASASPPRAYEMVTPANKIEQINAATAGWAAGLTADGDHVFFQSPDPVIGDADQSPFLYRADRGLTKWTTTSPIPLTTYSPNAGAMSLFYYDDGDLGIVTDTIRSFVPEDQDYSFIGNDYYRIAPDGLPVLMSPNELNPGPGTSESKALQGVTADGRGIVFLDSGDPLLPSDANLFGDKIYEFRDGSLRNIAVDDQGNPLLPNGGYSSVGSQQGLVTYHAYSSDGARIYFTATSAGDPADRPGLYLRSNASHTVPVPASPAGANVSSVYVGATEDGRKAYFWSPLQLTPDDHDNAFDLYEYDALSTGLTRISAGAAPAQFPGFLAAFPSNDGSRVYFASDAQLIAGKGSASGLNTYLFDHGTLRFVAPVSLLSGGQPCDQTRVSANGRYLLAVTSAGLSPQDHDGGAADVYRYDADTGELVLVSTGPADAQSGRDASINPMVSRCDVALLKPHHAMSDDGRYVFFGSAAALVARDTNGKPDVYQHDFLTGETTLISSGSASEGADFIDATPDGTSVLFGTADRLVGWDTDTLWDLYVARVGGGFPEPPAPSEACRESECQGPGHSPPAIQTPGSETLSAAASAAPDRSAAKAVGKLRLSRVTPAALRRLLRTGRLTLHVRAAKNARLVTTLQLYGGRGWTSAAQVGQSVQAGRLATVTLRLDGKERRLLLRHRRLLIRVHQAGVKDVVARYAVAGTERSR